MIKVIKQDDMLIPVKMWLDTVESQALDQITHLSNLPFTYHHIAIMPDCHSGYGMPIGGVMATEKVVIPNAVGVDIGCGMCAVKTNLKAEQLDQATLKKIMGKIREVVPTGFSHHKEKQDTKFLPEFITKTDYYVVEKEYDSALKQIGTLGGGNHFIEIQKDTDNNVWIMIHSGSRNLGFKVAKYYNDIAIKLNTKWFSRVPKEWELAFLPAESVEYAYYMTEMQYCVDFALANRKLMMYNIGDVFRDEFGVSALSTNQLCNETINIAHNYARMENHFDKNVMIHRKGATSAKEGEVGIIPGSQGTKSYIVKGLGNAESFMSCSHGAGRKLGRNNAIKTLNLEEEIKKLDEQGIVHGIRNQKDLDEASGAYKDIDEVMQNQADLVEILVELNPMAVIKGES